MRTSCLKKNSQKMLFHLPKGNSQVFMCFNKLFFMLLNEDFLVGQGGGLMEGIHYILYNNNLNCLCFIIFYRL